MPAWLLRFVLKISCFTLSCSAVSFSAVFYSAVSSAFAAPPVIAQIYPDFPSSSPHLIVGEGFSTDATEVWCWDPKVDSEQVLKATGRLTATPRLPASPPQEARRIKPLDIEAQVIVAPLSGSVAWVKTADGWSEPYLFNVPKPFWISDKTIATGELLHIFGFGLRARSCTIAFSGASGVAFPRITDESRSPRTADSRLVYFEVPLDAPPGDYEVWFHNGYGGEHGWARAGEVKVIVRRETKPSVFDVRQFGACGDDLGNDFEAIAAAVAKAAEATPSIVHLPPGTWRTDTEIVVPQGVEIRGAGWQNTTLQGFFDPSLPRDARTSAMLRITSDVTVRGLTFTGCVFQGSKSYNRSMITSPPGPNREPAHNITIRNCRFEGKTTGEGGGAEDLLTGRRLYHSNIALGGEYIRFLENEVFGTAGIGGHRVEIIGSTFHGGATVVLHNWVTDSLLDSNRFIDSPGRICFYPQRHCYLRYNEVHQAFRGTWANADEIYLAHGGAPQTTGRPTSATAATVTDAGQHWEPGTLRDDVLLITHGRGFGQYRRVVDNTENTLTLESPLRIMPDASSEYSVGKKYLESAFFANLNNTPSRLSLWLDCVGCVVENHRDVFAGGLDVWGQDRSNTAAAAGEQQLERFHPSYYNLFRNCWLDGSHALLWSSVTNARAYRGVPLFGNYICDNRLRSSHVRRTGFATARASRGAIQIGNPSGADLTEPQSRQVALSHTVVSGNDVSCNDVGVTVSDFAKKTFLLSNEFEEVDRPLFDWGMQTIIRDNRTRAVDDRGEVTTTIPNSDHRRPLTESTTEE